MGKALIVPLAMLVMLATSAAAAEPKKAVVGCVTTAKVCTCYSHSGRPVEMERDQCEARFAPTTFTKFEKGDITTLVTPVRIKPPVPENVPYRKEPIPWLFER